MDMTDIVRKTWLCKNDFTCFWKTIVMKFYVKMYLNSYVPKFPIKFPVEFLRSPISVDENFIYCISY